MEYGLDVAEPPMEHEGFIAVTYGLDVAEPPVEHEGFTAVTVKNAIFWDIKTQFVLHRRHITSPLQSSAG
jgi:hypothetical protein